MLQNVQNIFIVGIKGSALANLAVVLKKMGKNVSGSDVSEVFITDEVLTQNNIPVITSFGEADLPTHTDLIIYTGAHKGSNNPQVIEGVKRQIPTFSLAEANGEVVSLFEKTIAVCGTHGKTTTSSLCAYALKKLGAHPSYLIGTSVFNGNYGGDYDGKEYFVIEADEYGMDPPANKTPKFHLINPQYAICNNIDYDHPDIYANIEQIKGAFLTFFQKAPIHILYFCADDEVLMQVAKQIDRKQYVTYGYATDADLKIQNPNITEEYSEFELNYRGKELGRFQIALFGEKNISNSAGVIALLIDLGFAVEDIKMAIRDFTGAKRRFEKVAYLNDIYLFDDYGHHPKELETTINAARRRFKERRIIVIFHPHTYSRTLSLKDDFISALIKADISLIAPIYASARENKDNFPITSQDLEKDARKKGYENLKAFESKEEILQYLPSILRKGDVVFTMGAGDIYKMKDDIIKVINGVKN